MKLNLKSLQHACNQTGTVSVAGGLVHGFIVGGDITPAVSLVGIGLFLIILASLEEDK